MKNISKKTNTKPQLKLYCEPEFKEKLDKILNEENLEFSTVGRAMLIIFMSVGSEDRANLLGFAEYCDLMDRHPAVRGNFEAGITSLLLAAQERRVKKNE